MKRTTGVRAVLGWMAISSIGLGGCSMCQSPYDYSPPVMGSPAAYGQRQNSAFAGAPLTPQPMEMASVPTGQGTMVDAGTQAPPAASHQSPPAKRY